MTLRVRAAGENPHNSIADAALVAFENARADLQIPFDGKDSGHNLTLLRRRSSFGSDFVPAWMAFVAFLLRAMTMFRPGARRALLPMFSAFIGTVLANVLLHSTLAEADHQAVITDATVNSITFDGQLK